MQGKRFGLSCLCLTQAVFLMRAVGLLTLLCLPVQAQKRQNSAPSRLSEAQQLEAASRLDYLFDEKTAIRLLPSEAAIGQGVTRAEWSPDSRFVLAVRAPHPALPPQKTPVSIAIWDKTTHRSVELWSRNLAIPELAGPTQWLANAQIGIVCWRWMELDESGNWSTHEALVWINTALGVAHEIDSQLLDRVLLSPTQPVGIILHGNPPSQIQSFSVIAPDGSFSPAVPMLEDMLNCTRMRWRADSKEFYIEAYVAATAQDRQTGAKIENLSFGGPSVKKWFAVDTTNPGVVLLDKEPVGTEAIYGSIPPPAVPAKSKYDALHVKSSSVVLKQGDVETQIHPLWLATTGAKPMAALLCADGDRAQVAPSGDAVLYLTQTGVCVTTLRRAPQSLFTESILSAHQDDAVYRAWTLGQAVRMWSGDHKGVLPVPEDAAGSLQSLMPSLSLYEGFRYVWPGGALPAGARPTEAVVAEILGPGGVAQIFADGHSAWKSKP